METVISIQETAGLILGSIFACLYVADQLVDPASGVLNDTVAWLVFGSMALSAVVFFCATLVRIWA